MAHDQQEEITLTGEQYSCLLSRIASLERKVQFIELWKNAIQRWLNIAPHQ